ncbi:MAG TPA: SDR family oxidoreductase [Xanthobacteraceae bacterium]|nr:SDR family oxidoreductase [Xanthobacteraceae bacterium]
MDRPPHAPVVVITGASSGIGRATALAFARKRARLALVSREAAGLESAADECRAVGGQALVCSTDLTDLAAVERLRASVVAEYGRIDVWVSCAAVLLFGRFEDIPPDAFGRVIETNFLGCVNGSRVALAQFRAQGDQGTLINTSSLLGMMGEPYVSAYVATKFAIRGFTACLRQEFRDTPGIRICLVMPAAVDTPIYGKAGNYFGRQARSIVPVLAPERVARKIISLAERPRREVVVGISGHLLRWGATLTPMLLERIVGRLGPPLQFRRGAQPSDPGNLFGSAGPYAVEGGWKEYWAEKIGRRWR